MSKFQASSDTRFLAQELAKAAPGDTVSYEALSAAIGRDVRKHAYACLYSALRMQLSDQRVFEVVPQSGYRLLTSSEIVKTQAAKGFQRIGRVARKTTKRVASADYASLNKQEQVAHNTQLSMLGALAHMSKPAALTHVEKRVSEKSDQLAIGETLKLMTN